MKKENLVYVKLEYEEAKNSKTKLLSSEINLIKILRVIKKYNALRMEELKLKDKLKKRINSFNANIKKIENSLPEIESKDIPRRTTKRHEEVITKIKENKSKYDSLMEEELKQIQEKLASLQG